MTAPAVVDTAPEVPGEAPASVRAVRRHSVSHLAGLVASCLIVVVAFSPVLFGGRTLSGAGKGPPGTNGFAPFPGQPSPDYSSDFRLDLGASVWSLEPWAEVTRRAYSEGQLPLWNPYEAAGAPHAANMQSAVFDPLLLAVNLHPTPLTWDLSIIGAFVLGAAAAYLFGRLLGLRVLAAIVTSAAYSLSGWFFMYSNMAWNRSYAFLPLLFLLVELVLRSRRWLPVLGLGVAVAGNIYVGMPEASFFVVGAAVVYAAVRLVQERTRMPMRASLARLSGAGVLGLLLASPLVLLFLEYESLSFNVHKQEFARGTEADPAWGILHLIAPWFPGAPEPPSGPRNWLGIAVVVSAFVAVSGRRETRRLHAWLFLALGVVVLVKIYDFGVLEWVGDLPVVRLIVFFVFAAPIASFAFSVLAGIGVQVLWSRDLRLGRFLTLVAFGSIVLLAAFDASDRFRVIVEERQTVWGRTAFFAVLAVTVVVLAARLRRPRLAVLLAGVIVFELFWYAPFQIYAKRADPYLSPGWMALARTAQGSEPYSRVFALDGMLYPNTAGALGLQDIRVLDALYVNRYLRYVQTFIAPRVFDRFTGTEAPVHFQDNPMFDALSVRTVLSQRDLTDARALKFLGRDGDTRVYENTSALPRAWVVHQIHVVDGEDQSFAFLRKRSRRAQGAFFVDTFDPRREAVVERQGQETDEALRALHDTRTSCDAADHDEATIERYSADSVTLFVRSACPGMLVLPDTYYPGWKATVNGRHQTIYPTDGAFRGVPVPMGSSRVEFHYEPRAFSVGVALAVAGLAAFAVLWLGVGLRRRGRAHDDVLDRPSTSSADSEIAG